jgi:hypothetical protein
MDLAPDDADSHKHVDSTMRIYIVVDGQMVSFAASATLFVLSID